MACGCRKCREGKKYKGMKSPRLKGSDDSIFWRRCAREYTDREEARREKEEQPVKQGDILLSLQEDLRSHRKNMKRLGDRVVELERMINSSRLYLEDIAHKLDKTDVMGITNVKGKFIHVAARQSPYPSTAITRFPVFDKYVPLEIVYDVYDPKTYTMSKNQFPDGEIDYADEDINEIRQLQEERAGMSEDEVEGLPRLPEFMPVWNSMVTFKDSGVQRQVDRRSWIYADNQPLRYTLDALGIPQNPMGRTGMRGKGVLWRWGPNHVIKAVVTRWRRKYGPDLNTMTDFLYVEGKRVLEFIAVQKDNFMESSYGLPGDVLHGLANPYSILCKAFMSNVFDEQNTDMYQRFEQSDLIQFFAQFASQLVGGSSTRTSFSVSDGVPGPVRSTSYTMQPYMSESRTNLRTETDQQGFSATLLYKGYLDDPRNTDNAWVEAEVWNFHYDIGDNFDLRIQEESNVKWKEVSPYVKMFGNESVIVQEAARIHDAYH